MEIAKRVESFFSNIEEIWAAIPGYVKVFLYSVTSTSIGLYVSGELSFESVFIVLVTNLGIYQAPRLVNKEVKKLAQ